MGDDFPTLMEKDERNDGRIGLAGSYGLSGYCNVLLDDEPQLCLFEPAVD